MISKRTSAYIDSFNLYYGALRNIHNSKWLNIDAWLKTFLPGKEHDIQKIKYFTADVDQRPYDLQKPIRQRTYFRALETLPAVEIIRGTFRPKTVNIQVTADVRITARVPEEKGTDVNLAVHLLNDAHNNLFDAAVVVSNDGDLAQALAMVNKELGKEIWLINPSLGNPTNRVLSQHATHIREVREGAIRASQFNLHLTDAVGTFSKPASW